jgi:hypothetical protein
LGFWDLAEGVAGGLVEDVMHRVLLLAARGRVVDAVARAGAVLRRTIDGSAVLAPRAVLLASPPQPSRSSTYPPPPTYYRPRLNPIPSLCVATRTNAEDFLKKLPVSLSFRSRARAAVRDGHARATPSWAVLPPSCSTLRIAKTRWTNIATVYPQKPHVRNF